MQSPAPTDLTVTGAWTEGPPGAAISIASSTNATPIVVTLSQANYALLSPSNGDTVNITGHTTNTKANGVWEVSSVDAVNYKVTLLNADGSNSVGNGTGGASGTIRKINSCRVILSGALTTNIALNGNRGIKTNWTSDGGANVTPSILTTDYKEGGECLKIIVASGFTTGLAAHYQFPSQLDLSLKRQLSFWIKQTSGTVATTGDLSITICNGTDGTGTADTFAIPALPSLNVWTPITVDLGGAMGSAKNSIAFNIVTDRGAQTFYLDNIIACKNSTAADALTLQSLIGKNIAGDTFYSMQSINGPRVMLDQDYTATMPTTPPRGYFGATAATAATYKRETFKITAKQTMQEAGTEGSLITYSGGWDSTAMSSQTGETWYDGIYFTTYGFDFKNYTALNKISFSRCYAVTSTATVHHCNFNIPSICNSTQLAMGPSGYCTASLIQIDNACNSGILNIDTGNKWILGNVRGALTNGITLTGNASNVTFTEINGSVSYGIDAQSAGYKNFIYGGEIKNSAISDLSLLSLAQDVFMKNVTFSTVTLAAEGADRMAGLIAINKSADSTNHVHYLGNGTRQTETSIRHTASGISWKLSPTSSVYCTSDFPFYLTIAKWPCQTGVAVTFSVYMRRTNTGLTARLMCKGGQLSGVANDVSTAMTANADTWELITLAAITPTETGVLEIQAECYGGTTYSLYVDDFGVS